MALQNNSIRNIQPGEPLPMEKGKGLIASGK
jgi:hypothetical protein